MKLGAPVGHPQYFVRGGVSMLQGFCSLLLVAEHINFSHTIPTACMQFVAAGTLWRQYVSASSIMYVVRGCASFLRCVVLIRTAACGRVAPPWTGCDAGPFNSRQARTVFRAIHLLGALRQFANGLSLVFQYLWPDQGRTASRGHWQLHVRTYIRISGAPLHLARGILKLAVLEGTRYSRADAEVAINFVRALVLIPASSWSLDHHWRTSGADPPPRRVQYGLPCGYPDEPGATASVLADDHADVELKDVQVDGAVDGVVEAKPDGDELRVDGAVDTRPDGDEL